MSIFRKKEPPPPPPEPELTDEDIAVLTKSTHFNPKELQSWFDLFLEYASDYSEDPTKVLMLSTAADFHRMYQSYFPNGDPTQFSSHIFRSFDKNNDGYVDFREFITAMNIAIRGSLEQKLAWTFSMYDMNGCGYTTRGEMIEILVAANKMINSPITQTAPHIRVDRIFKKLDKNMDGRLSKKEFMRSAKVDLTIARVLAYDPQRSCDLTKRFVEKKFSEVINQHNSKQRQRKQAVWQMEPVS